MEVSFNELRCKDVINVECGKKLGRVIDLIISTTDKSVLGIVVPCQRKFFQPKEDLFVPWKNITKIGEDVIFVCIDTENCKNVVKTNGKQQETAFSDGDDYLIN